MSARLAAGLIAAVAFLVRLLHVDSYDPIPFSDMAVFADMATKRLTIANLLTPAGYCAYPPGYAFFLKPFYMLFDGVAATRAIQVAQAALGAWTCLLIGRLAARLHSRRAGVVAALIACFYPHYLFYTSAFMSETVFIFAYTAALLLLLRAMARPVGGSLYRAGLAISAAALVRPAALSLLPAAAIAVWRGERDVRARMRALAVVAAGVLTLIGPWAIRNRIAYGRLVLIAPNGSANLAIGNGAEANGGYRALPSFEGGDVEREKHWTTEALRFIEGDPWGALYVTLGRKWQAFWEMIPPWPLYSSNPELFEGEYFFPMPSWRLVFSLGLIGLAPCLRRRGLWIVPASGLAYVLFYMVFFGQARFRMPIEGLFIASAGGAVVSVAALLPRLRRARAPAWSAAASILLLVVLAQSSASAAEARAFLRSEASFLRAGDQFPVPPGAGRINLFTDDRIPVDRALGRYLKVSFDVFRQGPERANPTIGSVTLRFFRPGGEETDWSEQRTYVLEAVPKDRWVSVSFKTQIPPDAATCDVRLLPRKDSPDVVLVDRSALRYAHGNDPALEFLFPYLSPWE